jgi:alkylhydroperoxidase family enzyme
MQDEGRPMGNELIKVETNAEGKAENRLPALMSQLEGKSETMDAFSVAMLAPGRHVANENARQLLSKGAVDLFEGLAPADAIERHLAILASSVTNASVDCLMQAAAMSSSEHLEARDLNLRHGFKGAAVAAGLIQALDARRGNSVPREVTVRDVNVQAGAQAIIGNVEASRRKRRSGLNASEPPTREEGPELEENDG